MCFECQPSLSRCPICNVRFRKILTRLVAPVDVFVVVVFMFALIVFVFVAVVVVFVVVVFVVFVFVVVVYVIVVALMSYLQCQIQEDPNEVGCTC